MRSGAALGSPARGAARALRRGCSAAVFAAVFAAVSAAVLAATSAAGFERAAADGRAGRVRGELGERDCAAHGWPHDAEVGARR